MAVAPDGTAVAVWSQSGDGGPVVEAARRRPAQGWSAAIPVTAPGEQGRAPQVAIDAQDNATVVWRRRPGRAGARRAAPRRARRVRAGRHAVERDAAGPAGHRHRRGRHGGGRVRGGGERQRARAQGRHPAAGGRGLRRRRDHLRQLPQLRRPHGRRAAGGIGVDAAGGAVAAWAGFDGTRFLVRPTSARRAARSPASGQTRSSTEGRASGTDPALAVDPAGGATVAWTHDADATDAGNATEVRWSERLPGEGFGDPASVDAPEPTAAPSLAAGADGTVVGAWVLGSGDDRRVQLAVKPRGQAFSGQREASPPGPFVRPAAHGDGAGAALVTWAGASDEAILSVRRSRGGAVGAVQQAANRAGAGDARDFSAPAVALDDEGNGTAVWTVTDHGDGGDVFHVQAAGHDAAAPEVFGVQVRPNPRATTAVPLSVAATDRWSPVSYAWSFGDDGFAAGGAVRHVWRAPGPFTVAVTATDAVGNAAVATRDVVVGPAPVRRVRTPVDARWRPAPALGLVVLARLQVRRPPRGTVVRLRCSGARCPVRRMTVRRVRRARHLIDVAAALRAPQRRFRPGQVVTVRITAPLRIGRVLRYRLRGDAAPRVRRLCLPVGATKPQARCPGRRPARRGGAGG